MYEVFGTLAEVGIVGNTHWVLCYFWYCEGSGGGMGNGPRIRLEESFNITNILT